jgi:predicted Rossmann fold flavoprotein
MRSLNPDLEIDDKPFDVAIIGAGAAGLMAALFAARQGARTVALDGAKKIGAKILISGGGRCNVTHDVVRAEDFNGNRNIIAKVLRSFDVPETVAFFREIGVELKREESGKLFPVTDRARTVLDALLREASRVGVSIAAGERVIEIAGGPQFRVVTATRAITAQRVILATGGRSVPKTGSDGSGYALARAFGHTIAQTFPALVPLVLPNDHWLTALSGTSVDADLVLRADGRKEHRQRGSMLFTHFGISGPVVLDMSRHWIAACDRSAALSANVVPPHTFESLDAHLVDKAQANPKATVASALRGKIPERLLQAVAEREGIAAVPVGSIARERRRRLVHALTDLPLPVITDRGFDYAEVTAGGVPLQQIDAATMASRCRTGLFLCGEILDVDGRIGGYNFQWAWASGRLAGIHAASAVSLQ